MTRLPRLLGTIGATLGVRLPEPAEVEAQLQRTLDAATEVFALAGAGLLLLGPAGTPRLVATSGPGVLAWTSRFQEQIEQLAQDALDRGRIVAPGLDAGWADLVRELAESGVYDLLAVPLRAAGHGVGVLDLYRDRPLGWPADRQQAAGRYAELVAALVQWAVLTRPAPGSRA